MAGVRPAALLLLLLFGCTWADSEPRHVFNIEPQALGDSLQEFANQSGVQLIFFSKLVEGHVAPALHGRFTATEALDRLLARSGLVYRQINPTTFEVRSLESAVEPEGEISRLPVPGVHERMTQRLVVNLVEDIVQVECDPPVRVDFVARTQIEQCV